MLLTQDANICKKAPGKRASGESEINHHPQEPLFDEHPVQRVSLEKDKNKSEGSHKIGKKDKKPETR